jgi:hypothetical protein
MRFRAAVSVLILALITGGCLHDDEEAQTRTVRETVTETETGTGTVPNEAPTILKIYLLREGKVAPVSRSVVADPAVATAAVNELLASGSEAGLTSAIPRATKLSSLTIGGGVATIALTRQLTDRRAQAQLVYTLTQFPTVKRVDFGGARPVGRAAFEAQTPPVLVESPLPGDSVDPGFAATGTANTFEATFNYELRNAADRVISKNFVTATSGSGTRGTFRFTVPYEIDDPQQGSLVVFEISAADGSRINEVEIPLRLG